MALLLGLGCVLCYPIAKTTHSFLPNSSLILSCACYGSNYECDKTFFWGLLTPNWIPTKFNLVNNETYWLLEYG